MYLLNTCYLTHLIVYPKLIGSGIQITVKPNKLSSAMIACRHGFHNGVMPYMLQFGESTIHRIFGIMLKY